MEHYEFSWRQRELEIYAQGWEPESPKAVIGVVHGLGEHSGRYRAFAERLTAAGHVVLAFDHIGHGKSQGKRGHINEYDDLLHSVRKLLKEADKRYHELPKFLFGQSMGGNIATNYVLRKKPDIEGAIINSPWFRTAFDPPAIKQAMGKLMRNIYPGFRERTGLNADKITRIPEEVEAYANDPMIHDWISTQLYFSILEAGEWALENADKLEIPMLLSHGTADGLTDCKAAEEFKQNSNELLNLKLYDGGYHELHNDSCRDEYFDFLIQWIEKRD